MYNGSAFDFHIPKQIDGTRRFRDSAIPVSTRYDHARDS